MSNVPASRSAESQSRAAQAFRDDTPEGLSIGFATRLRFLSMAELEASRAARYGLALSIVLFVLEDREAMGLATASDLERCDWEIGNRLAGSIRQGPDALARLAAGDWAVLLPHTTLDGAVCVAQRCLDRMADHELNIGVRPVRLALSAGAAAYQPLRRHGERTVGALLQTAARAQRESSALGSQRAVGFVVES